MSSNWLADSQHVAILADDDPGAVVVEPREPAGAEHLHQLLVRLFRQFGEGSAAPNRAGQQAAAMIARQIPILN